MNNSISFRRTVLYARKHYVENARYYGYGLLAILILLSVFAGFTDHGAVIRGNSA